MKQKINTEIYAEKTIATYETKYRDNPLSKPQEIVLTITAGHLYGKAFVCEQVATKEEDIFYSKFSASISDISNITINTYIKELPIYISFEKPSKDNKYAKDRRRIILPSFDNPENIVAQITETKDKIKYIKKNSNEVTYTEDYSENSAAKSGMSEIIDIWDNIMPESDEIAVTAIESEVISETVADEENSAVGSLEFESEVIENDDFIEEILDKEDTYSENSSVEEEFRTPPIAPAPPSLSKKTDEPDYTEDEPAFNTLKSDAIEFDIKAFKFANDEAEYEAAETMYSTSDETSDEDTDFTAPEEQEISFSSEEQPSDSDEDEQTYNSVSDEKEAEPTEDETIDVNPSFAEAVDDKEPEFIAEKPKTEVAKSSKSKSNKVDKLVAAKETTPEITQVTASPAKSSLESFEESMKKLKIMYESGVITTEEFNAEKRNILSTLY
ncbi:MAG: SHOCT domain-containing protein [Ruminococcus sp.]|nr:SHOCT domain-containing protein [Ruminococcus sp.]